MPAEGGSPGTLTLIGSGELAPSMSRVHRSVLARLPGEPRAVFIDTPAGFEPNVDDITAKAVAYFERYLGATCVTASFRDAAQASPVHVDRAVRAIRHANYVFAGPGSPTYAIRNWRDTAVVRAVEDRLAQGGEVVLASAAAIAASAYAVPVYEIFKAGIALHWVDGLDVLGPYGLRLAIVPHWNNAEGGSYDTRYCFMGKERFERMRALLEPSVVILGLDEYTACQISLAGGWCTVLGAGAATIQRDGDVLEYGAGDRFPLDALRSRRAGTAPTAVLREPPARNGSDAADLVTVRSAAERATAEGSPLRLAAAALDLAEAIEAAAASAGDAQLADARAALGDLVSSWSRTLELERGSTGDIGAYVELLLGVRRALREQRLWQLADTIRDGLGALGVTLEDGPEGTAWRLA